MDTGTRLQMETAIEQNDLPTIQALLAAHPDLLHARDVTWDRTWLHYAAGAAQPDLARFFFREGLPLTTTDTNGHSPLDAAAGQQDPELVGWLLREGADPNVSRWAMIHAVSGGNLEIVKLLVEHGANFDFLFGEPPRTPLSQADEFGHPHVAEYLRSRGAALPPEPDPGAAPAFDLHAEVKEYFEYKFDRAPETHALQELIPGQVGVSVWSIRSGGPSDPQIIFTTGMSAQPLRVPAGCEEFQYAELAMYLPPDWPSPPDLGDTSQSWPWIWLRKIAHYTHEQQTWLGDWTTTFANGEPAAPLDASTDFAGFVLATNMAPLEGFPSDAGHYLNIVLVVPVYPEELALAKQENGTVELLQRFKKRGIGVALKPGRANVAVETGFLRGLFRRGK